MSEKPRVRRARVWVVANNEASPHVEVAHRRSLVIDAPPKDWRKQKRDGWYCVRGTVTWTEPAPKRKPRHDR